jgi:hypothetical protein
VIMATRAMSLAELAEFNRLREARAWLASMCSGCMGTAGTQCAPCLRRSVRIPAPAWRNRGWDRDRSGPTGEAAIFAAAGLLDGRCRIGTLNARYWRHAISGRVLH